MAEETKETVADESKVEPDQEITPLMLCNAYLSQVGKSDHMAVLIDPKEYDKGKNKGAYGAFSVHDAKFKVYFESVKRARRRKIDVPPKEEEAAAVVAEAPAAKE